MAYGNDMFDLNIQALSASENGEFSRYKNVTDKSSNTEFKTEVSTGADGTKVSVEYKRTCTVCGIPTANIRARKMTCATKN